MNRRTLVISILATLVVTMNAFAGRPSGGGTTSTSLTSTVNDWDYSLATYFRLRSDFLQTGSNTYVNGISGVVSHFQTGGAYELSTLNSVTRRVFIDLSEPLNGTVPAGMLSDGSSGYVLGRFVSKFAGIDLMTGVGSQLTGGLPLVFTGADGKNYQLRMNAANEIGTTDATVTCTHVQGADQSSPAALCDGWTLAPAGGGKAVGRLLRAETIKGKTTLTYFGDFLITYQIDFTRP